MDTIKIVGNPLYQWELGRKVQIFPLPNMTVDEVHFSNHGDPEALVVKPKEEDGMIIAEIPNILLQSGTALIVYSVNVAEGFTDNLRSCTFNVRKRAKPSDYVYTEVEILNYETLKHRMDEFEKNGVSEKQIANAVESYMNENPVEITGVVKTVNGTAPDESGNVEIEIPEADTSDCVKTVNGTAPDENGNVELPVPEGTVKSVNGVKPDEQGNVEITIPDSGGNAFYVNVTKSTTGHVTADKTNEEIWNAYTENRAVFCRYKEELSGDSNVSILPLVTCSENSCSFVWTATFNNMAIAVIVSIEENEASAVMDVGSITTEQYVKEYAQPKGNYLTEVPEGYAKTTDIPTDEHINSLIDTKLAQFSNAEGVSF